MALDSLGRIYIAFMDVTGVRIPVGTPQLVDFSARYGTVRNPGMLSIHWGSIWAQARAAAHAAAEQAAKFGPDLAESHAAMAQVLAWLDWDWAAADVELKRAQRALRVAAILIFLSLVVFAKLHEPTRFAYTLQKLAHPVTFGAVALLFLTLLRRQTPRRFGSYVVAFALTVLCGAGTEAAQAFVDRGPSLLDVLRDALGASTALAGFATLARARMPARDSRGPGVCASAVSKIRRKFSPLIFATSFSPRPRASSAAGIRFQSR
jgi:VanZ family protein